MKYYNGTCSIYGGPGVGRPMAAFSYFSTHSDPNVCQYYLEKAKQRKKNQLKLVRCNSLTSFYF